MGRGFWILAVSGAIGVASAQTHLDDPVVGDWRTEDGHIIEIEPCGDTICGHVVVFDAPSLSMDAAELASMPDAETRRGHPVCQARVLFGDFVYKAPGKWEAGHVFNPRNGETYNAKLQVKNDRAILKMRGYLGVPALGKTQEWTRVEDLHACPVEAMAIPTGEVDPNVPG